MTARLIERDGTAVTTAVADWAREEVADTGAILIAYAVVATVEHPGGAREAVVLSSRDTAAQTRTMFEAGALIVTEAVQPAPATIADLTPAKV